MRLPRRSSSPRDSVRPPHVTAGKSGSAAARSDRRLANETRAIRPSVWLVARPDQEVASTGRADDLAEATEVFRERRSAIAVRGDDRPRRRRRAPSAPSRPRTSARSRCHRARRVAAGSPTRCCRGTARSRPFATRARRARPSRSRTLGPTGTRRHGCDHGSALRDEPRSRHRATSRGGTRGSTPPSVSRRARPPRPRRSARRS